MALINDHVVRLAVMIESHFWHLHPNSDECFMVIEGVLRIDLEDKVVELPPSVIYDPAQHCPSDPPQG